MTKTEIKAVTGQIIRTIRALPWGELCNRTAALLRACWVAAQLLLTAVALAWDVAYEHRREIRDEIRDALVLAIACLVVATERTIRAGHWTRQQIDRLGQLGAVVLQLEPMQALVAAREALERLIRRLYPLAA